MFDQGILEGVTVPLTSCLIDLDKSVLQITTKIVSCHTADLKPVKQEVNSTVILPPFSIPWFDPGRLFQPCLKLASQAGAYPSEAPSTCSTVG